MQKRLCDYHDGEDMDLVAMLKIVEPRTSQRGQHYLALTFSDQSGTLRGNLWQATKQDAATFTPGTLVQISGRRTTYHGQAQVTLDNLQVVGPNEGYDLGQFVRSAPLPIAKAEEGISKKLFEIANPTWNRIVRYLLSKWHDRFFSYPAGKSNHHAVRAGLAFHTYTMLQVAAGLCQTYPQLDKSLLYAGCILHDMGKVIELSGPVSTQYTKNGNLIGHLVLIDEQIVLAAQHLGLDEQSEDLLLLRHMVLSHHGQLDYGSPKRPALLEAEILHRIDDMDAAVYAITAALQKTDPGHFTNPIPAQDNRRFYRPEHNQTLTRIKRLD